MKVNYHNPEDKSTRQLIYEIKVMRHMEANIPLTKQNRENLKTRLDTTLKLLGRKEQEIAEE